MHDNVFLGSSAYLSNISRQRNDIALFCVMSFICIWSRLHYFACIEGNYSIKLDNAISSAMEMYISIALLMWYADFPSQSWHLLYDLERKYNRHRFH